MIYKKDGKILMDSGKLRGCCCGVEKSMSASCSALGSCLKAYLWLSCQSVNGCQCCIDAGKSTPEKVTVKLSGVSMYGAHCCNISNESGFSRDYSAETIGDIADPTGTYVLIQTAEDSCRWAHEYTGNFGTLRIREAHDNGCSASEYTDHVLDSMRVNVYCFNGWNLSVTYYTSDYISSKDGFVGLVILHNYPVLSRCLEGKYKQTYDMCPGSPTVDWGLWIAATSSIDVEIKEGS